MIQNDRQIRELVKAHNMIEPFELCQIRERGGFTRTSPPDGHVAEDGVMESWGTAPQKVISYGTSSFGYDIRCADEFKVFTNIHTTVVDPKNFDDKCFVDFSGQGRCIIPPNSFALARTVEYFRIPQDVMTICVGKSTYARCGIIVNVTPFEPGFEGHVTLEFSNTTPLPAIIYADEGCAQVLFFRGERPEVTYSDRKGKYQGQIGVTVPRM